MTIANRVSRGCARVAHVWMAGAFDKASQMFGFLSCACWRMAYVIAERAAK